MVPISYPKATFNERDFFSFCIFFEPFIRLKSFISVANKNPVRIFRFDPFVVDWLFGSLPTIKSRKINYRLTCFFIDYIYVNDVLYAKCRISSSVRRKTWKIFVHRFLANFYIVYVRFLLNKRRFKNSTLLDACKPITWMKCTWPGYLWVFLKKLYQIQKWTFSHDKRAVFAFCGIIRSKC